MIFHLEGGKNKNTVEQSPEVRAENQRSAETRETAENYEDCSRQEVQKARESDTAAESAENTGENYDDCETRVGETRESLSEADEDDDDFSDCGKESDEIEKGADTLEVEEGTADVPEEDFEDGGSEEVQRLAENAQEDIQASVNNRAHRVEQYTEVAEHPEKAAEEIAEEKYEQEKEKLEKTEELLEAQQEALQEQEESAGDPIEQEKDSTEQVENAERDGLEDGEGSPDMVAEIAEEPEAFAPETEIKNEAENEIKNEIEENTDSDLKEESSDVAKESDDAADTEPEKTSDADEPKPEQTEPESEQADEQTEEPDKTEEALERDSENTEKDEASLEAEKPLENTEEPDETVPENRAEEVAETDDLNSEQAGEQDAEKDAGAEKEKEKETEKENLSEEAEETAEKEENVDEATAEEKKETDAVEALAENADKQQAEQLTEEEKPLQERIEDAANKEDVSADELKALQAENTAALTAKMEEKESAEAELKGKFEEVLSKERGSEEYKQALAEYNALQSQKEDLTEQIATMEKQQDLLEQKSLALHSAQIEKGDEAMTESTRTLANVDMLQERYDSTYRQAKPDKKELASIREENSSAMQELSAEKDSIEQAMHAKMDEISEYVTSHNMGRYETSHDAHYQRLSAEYTAMQEKCGRIEYSIVKLDENNKEISEHLGDKYTSLRELSARSPIAEVNNGTDIPGETDYFKDGRKASEVLSPFKQNSWEKLSAQEQKEAVGKLADYNAEILGIQEKPEIVYYQSKNADEFGGYSEEDNTIYINEQNMQDAAETADTISHEYRHKYQHERTEKLENERDLAYKEGFEDYVRAEDDYQGYKEQLVEADARAYAEVVKNKIDGTAEKIHTNAGKTEGTDLKTEAPSDLPLKEGDRPPHDGNGKWEEVREPSAAEVEKTLPQTDSSSLLLEKTGFLTNDGERIQYEDAVGRITDKAEQYMASLNVSEEVRARVIADMRSELYAQQKEAESRNLGDHGIRHIYGNFERGEQYLDSRADMTDEQRLAVLVSQVYHDEGYRTEPNNMGTLRKGYSDAKHDEASLEFWQAPERQAIYEQVFAKDTLQSIETAIGKHNTDTVEDIQKNTSIKEDPIVSTVHVCDKLALSQREKFSELLTSDPELVELTENMNATMGVLKDERLGFYENGELTEQGQHLLDEYQARIQEHIDKKGYDSEYAKRLKEAVNKDVGLNAAKYSSRMNYIYTPSDCYQYNPETQRNEITVFAIDYPEDTANDLSHEQVEKLLKDLGLSKEEAKLAAKKGEYDFGEERGLSVKIKPITEEEIRKKEAARFQENNDLKEINEYIEAGRKHYSEVSDQYFKIASLTEGQDANFAVYSDFAMSNDIVVDCTEEEFAAYSPEKKKQLMTDAVTKAILSDIKKRGY